MHRPNLPIIRDYKGDTSSFLSRPWQGTNKVERSDCCTYRDFSREIDEEACLGIQESKTKTFPVRLHTMLRELEDQGIDDIASWRPHGRSFVIRKHKQFEEKIMKRYFRQSKFSSFQRQLNIYGFKRITAGPDKGGYYHELFLKYKCFLCRRMRRTTIKGTGVRQQSSPESEPNLYAFPPLTPQNNKEFDEDGISDMVKSSVVPQDDCSRSTNRSMKVGACVSIDRIASISHEITCPRRGSPWRIESDASSDMEPTPMKDDWDHTSYDEDLEEAAEDISSEMKRARGDSPDCIPRNASSDLDPTRLQDCRDHYTGYHEDSEEDEEEFNALLSAIVKMPVDS